MDGMTERERQLAVRALRKQAHRLILDSRLRTYRGAAGEPYRRMFRAEAEECTKLADKLCRVPGQ